MTINLSEITFTNDFYATVLSDESILRINKLEEDFLILDNEIKVDGLNIEIVSEDGSTVTPCSTVIGLEQDYFTIDTDYTEYLGKCLSLDNLKYCRIEVKEDE